MPKTVLITGSTDGIGLAAAQQLVAQGHEVLLHGRNPTKLQSAQKALAQAATGPVEAYAADLSRLSDVETLADAVMSKHERLDALVNNAGVLAAPSAATSTGLDLRFMVNAVAPYRLTQRLRPLLGRTGRVINVSSAAQSPVQLDAMLRPGAGLSDFEAYAQSKLALTMWSRALALACKDQGPMVMSLNPGSMLGTKMVKEAFGSPGHDIGIGADILVRAAVAEEFEDAGGRYFDNDARRFGSPHPDAADPHKTAKMMEAIETVVADLLRSEKK